MADGTQHSVGTYADEARDEAPCTFDDLPVDLKLDVAHAANLRTAMHLCQASRALHEQLVPVQEEAAKRRLRWDKELTRGGSISDDGRTFTKADDDVNWAVGGLLTSSEDVISWSVRIDHVDERGGNSTIGVCHEAGCCAWGLNLFAGSLMLERYHFDTEDECLVSGFSTSPPDGWPDGHDTQLIVTAGVPAGDDNYRAEDAVIDVIVDRAKGLLAFRVNGTPRVEALSGFPPGAQLRPWAHIGIRGGDGVTLTPGYYSYAQVGS